MLERRSPPQRDSTGAKPEPQDQQCYEQEQRNQIQQQPIALFHSFNQRAVARKHRAGFLERLHAGHGEKGSQRLIDRGDLFMEEPSMRQHCPCRLLLESVDGHLLRESVDALLERPERVGRRIPRQMENGSRQCACRRCELRVLAEKCRAGTEKADIGERVAQQRIAGLEALQQLFLQDYCGSKPVGRSGVESLATCVGLQSRGRILHPQRGARK